MIDLTVNKKQLKNAVKRAKERKIIIPTFSQQIDPNKIPLKIRMQLRKVSLWDVNVRNLFRITWKNEPQEKGGLFNDGNVIEIPSELSGVKAKILCMVGKWFPVGAHKVGATFGCLVPRLVTGQFDPTKDKAVWPSTGNFCRGGAYNSALLGCDSIAILPQEMSQERFKWLEQLGGEIIATPGCESNVKEIFDKCWELRNTRKDIMIFNQFEEMGNHLWHYWVTGNAMKDILKLRMKKTDRFSGVVLTSGSAGTTGCADFLKEQFPGSKFAVSEALQCPTLLYNGFGAHQIEGIGDKHVPWIHNVRNTDMVVAIDDDHCVRLVRLFNEKAGQKYLEEQGVDNALIENLNLFGISGIANLLSAIKFAKYYELTEKDYVMTVLTDSMDLYQTKLKQLRKECGRYKAIDAAKDYHGVLMAAAIDNVKELGFYDKKRIHSLKYYTWVEQQGRSVEELDAQWSDYPEYWQKIHKQVETIDRRIKEFNNQVGILKS